MERFDITQELRDEHDLILEWIELIGELVRLSRGSFAESPLAIHFPVVDDFLGVYSDQFHHAKEEDVLFGVLERAISHCGPIPVMLREHAIGRALRTRMGEAFRARDLESLLGASRDYCGLLTQHIAKENDILYPMAEHCIPDEERRPIQEAYAAAALHHGARALRERFERERDTLRAKLG